MRNNFFRHLLCRTARNVTEMYGCRKRSWRNENRDARLEGTADEKSESGFLFGCQQVVAESEELNVEGFVCARSQAKLLLLVKRMRDESRIRARKFHVSIPQLDRGKV